MSSKNINFEILPSTDIGPAVNYGQSTSVHLLRTLSGADAVEKTMRFDGYFEDRPKQWYKSTLSAKQISDRIRLKNNPAYFVPKTFISHGKVREQFAGNNNIYSIYKYDKEYFNQLKPKLTIAIGNFINDMSELEPVKKRKWVSYIPGIWIKNGKELDIFLSDFTDILSDKNLKTFKDVFKYICSLPEVKEQVMSHKDLGMSNTLINKDTEKISIIDFEMVGYMSKFTWMYFEYTNPDLWEYVNRLPRTKNPNLRWDYDENKLKLYTILRASIDEMQYLLRHIHEQGTSKFIQEFDKIFSNVEFILGQARLHDKKIENLRNNNTAAIVAARHYEKE